MDFDSLHDPTPPVAGGREFAAVAQRARALGRRRRAVSGVAAVAAVASVAGFIVVARPESAPLLQPDQTFESSPSTAPLLTAPPSTIDGGDTPCTGFPLSLPWMPDGSTPAEPVRHLDDVGASPYALTWTDSTGDVTLWTNGARGTSADPAQWQAVEIELRRVTPTTDGPSLFSATQWVTPTGVAFEVDRISDGCRRTFEFGGSEGTAGTTLTFDTLGPLVADWLDAWNLFAAATVTRTSEASGTAMCFAFVGVTHEAPCVPLTGPDTYTAVDPVVIELWDEPIGDMPVRLVAGLVTEERFAPTTQFPLGGVDQLGEGDPRRFVWGLVSPQMCERGIASSDLFLSTICSPDLPVLEPVPDRNEMVVGIDTHGDAILFRPGADPVVLYDGTEPGSVAVEGDLSFVDHVALSPDGRRAVVSTCCEPMAGSFVIVDTETREVVETGVGHLAEYTSWGDLVIVSEAEISLIDGEKGGMTIAHLFDLSNYPWSSFSDLAVIGDEVFALSVEFRGDTGVATSRAVGLHSVQAVGGDMFGFLELERLEPISGYVHDPATDAYLVGSTNVLFVADSTGTLRAFDPESFREVDAAGQFGVTPLWVGNQGFTVSSGADGTVLSFDDTVHTFPGVHLTFART